MAVDRRDVERVATLARLEFSDAELDSFTVEMNGILAFFEHWLIRRTGARLLFDLRTLLFEHLLTLS